MVQRILYLQVLDYDRFSRNDPIGEVSIPLNKVDLTQMQTFWKDLKPCSDGSVRPHPWAPGGSGLADPPLSLRDVMRVVGRGADGPPQGSRVPTSACPKGDLPELRQRTGALLRGPCRGRCPDLPDEGRPHVTEMTDGGQRKHPGQGGSLGHWGPLES